jgi:hypothetical protein
VWDAPAALQPPMPYTQQVWLRLYWYSSPSSLHQAAVIVVHAPEGRLHASPLVIHLKLILLGFVEDYQPCCGFSVLWWTCQTSRLLGELVEAVQDCLSSSTQACDHCCAGTWGQHSIRLLVVLCTHHQLVFAGAQPAALCMLRILVSSWCGMADLLAWGS